MVLRVSQDLSVKFCKNARLLRMFPKISEILRDSPKIEIDSLKLSIHRFQPLEYPMCQLDDNVEHPSRYSTGYTTATDAYTMPSN